MHATLRHLADLPLYREEKPYKMLNFPGIDPKVATNCKYIDVSGVPLTSVRGIENHFSIEGCGFKFCTHRFENALTRSELNDPREKDGLVKKYLQEVVDVVREELQADKTICFDWRLRSNIPPEESPDVPLDDIANARSYTMLAAQNVHCDYTYKSGLEKVLQYTTFEEQKEFEQGKWHIRLVNFWRPLRTVQNAPLALCDRRTVNLEDYVSVDGVKPDGVEEEVYVKRGPNQRWYWLPDQSPDEQLLFLTWDSVQEGLAKYYTPHVAAHLEDPETLGTPPRESVEVRLMVMHKINDEQCKSME